MKLWLLRQREGIVGENPWCPWYDKTFGFVVRAETEDRARAIANENGGAEKGPVSHSVYRTGGDPWLDPAFSTCVELTGEGIEEVVIEDHASA